jgi:hypothetical protein
MIGWLPLFATNTNRSSRRGLVKEWVRRWLGLDGPGGLADVLTVKDQRLEAAERSLDDVRKALGQIIPVLNDHTTSLQRFAVYERQVPSIKRVFDAMREKALREQRRKAAEAAIAAPPVDPAPPQDAVLDEVSAEVGGG